MVIIWKHGENVSSLTQVDPARLGTLLLQSKGRRLFCLIRGFLQVRLPANPLDVRKTWIALERTALWQWSENHWWYCRRKEKNYVFDGSVLPVNQINAKGWSSCFCVSKPINVFYCFKPLWVGFSVVCKWMSLNW